LCFLVETKVLRLGQFGLSIHLGESGALGCEFRF